MSEDILKHKGYFGTSEISSEDGCYFGKILSIKDLVTYEADSADALNTAFVQAVDYYLEKCSRASVFPDEPSRRSERSITG